jgi:hypothetical protein
MELNTIQIFGKKVCILHWSQEGKKKAKKPSRTHEKFDILDELNTLMKILVFYILSFQSSWHFAFYILWGTKHSHSLYHCSFYDDV